LPAKGRERTRRSAGVAGPAVRAKTGPRRTGEVLSAKEREESLKPGKPAPPPAPSPARERFCPRRNAKEREKSLKQGKRVCIREGTTGEDTGFHGGRGGRTKKGQGDFVREGTRKNAKEA
jgi:hypothetical protein